MSEAQSSMSSLPAQSKSTRKRDKFKNLFKNKFSSSLASSTGTTRESANANVSRPSTLETLQISGRFAQSILPSLAGCVDANPAKTAFNILNVIMDVMKKINDNQDELQAVLEETLKLLRTVFANMELGSNLPSVVTQTIEEYRSEIIEQLERIQTINLLLSSSVFHQIDYEHYKTQLTDISRKIGGATNRFNTAMARSTGMIVDELREEKREKKLRKDLQPSAMADHRFIHDGKNALKREVCTEGTRVTILKEISDWANDSSAGSPPVFWLTGQAGSGKTTIAFTITKKFEKGQPTVLGANFLCSRQFQETRSLQRIVPTIAFQLALRCEPYRTALLGTNTSEAVHSYTVHQQVEEFLFRPWKERKHAHGLPTYLVVVDALDEIEEVARSTFLEAILELIQANNIIGLKFLVTSRPDPDIVKLCKTFSPGAICQLQNVPIENAKLDIKTYLDIKLKDLRGTPEIDKLNEQAAGLFIYAATVVKMLTGRKFARSEQLKRLRSLLSTSSGFGSIDQLYQQIMRDAFADLGDDPELLSDRLSVLHTFLCSVERISPLVAATLLDIDVEIAHIVLDNLHAVLYVQDGLVYWYHASFPDFIFNHTRSNFCTGDKDSGFSCDAAAQHRILLEGCFRVMNSKHNGLRFNMGDIKSSYLLDCEHAEELREHVAKNISSALRYSCIHWSNHLCFSAEIDDGNICVIISDFLRIRVLFWIEAMNLLGSSGNCSHLLQNVGQWVSKLNNNWTLAKDLQEAANFTVHFSGSPASASTPHLYISSLATWQSTSTLSKYWKNEFLFIPLYKHTKGNITVPLMTKRVNRFVQSMTFSNDGKQVVVGLPTAAIVLDATTGRQLCVLSKAEHCYLVKFSSDGTRIVTISEGLLDIWDALTLQLLKRFNVAYATVSVERTQILTASSKDVNGDCQLEVLDIVSGISLRQLKMVTTADYSFKKMAFSSVLNKILILSGKDFAMWDIFETISELKDPIMLSGHTGRINEITIFSDRKQVATCSSDTSLRVWDAATGNVSMVLSHKNAVLALHFSYDGTRIVSATMDGTVHVWDVITGALLKVLFTNADSIHSVAFSHDGSRICSGSLDVHVWPWEESTRLEEIHDAYDRNSSDALTSRIHDIRMSDDCQNIICATSDKVHIWDASTGAELMAVSCPAIRWTPKLSGNGDTVVSYLPDGSLVVLDLKSGDKMMHLESNANSYILFAATSRSGRKFAFNRKTTHPDKTAKILLEIWNVENGREIEIAVDNWLSFLAFSNDEQYILCGMAERGAPRCIIIRKVSTGDVIHKMFSQITNTDRTGVKFSTNGREIVICSSRLSTELTSDFLFELWDISTGKLLKTVQSSHQTNTYDGELVPTLWVHSLALSNNGEKIAASCSDGFIRVWDLFEGATAVVIGFGGSTPTIGFSRDDKQIVSGSWDGSVRVWDLDIGKYDWRLEESDWITSRKTDNKLMWVSDLLRVIQPCNILIISSRGHGTVEFDGAMIGKDWEKCYTPQKVASKEQ